MARPRKGLRSRARPDAKLEYLSYNQHVKLCQWLLTEGLSYEDIEKKIKRGFGFSISGSAIAQFYKQHIVKHLTSRRQRAVDVAMGYVEEAEKTPAQFATAAMDALQVKLVKASFDPTVSAKELKIYSELLLRWSEQKLRAQEVQLKMRRVQLLERRQKKLEAVFSMESKLNSDEVAQRVRLIFKQNGHDEPTTNNNEETPIQDQRLPALPP